MNDAALGVRECDVVDICLAKLYQILFQQPIQQDDQTCKGEKEQLKVQQL